MGGDPHKGASKPPLLTREALLDPGRRASLQRAYPYLDLLSEDELARALDATLAAHPAGADVWLFAYGSLIWNPMIAHVERKVGKVHGWHRSFCLRADAGRGSPERPGLFLGLKPGGACRGILYRLAASEARAELTIVWRREMMTGAYVPRWVVAATLDGPVRAIAMTVNRRHRRYVGDLGEGEAVRWIATAEAGSAAAATISSTRWRICARPASATRGSNAWLQPCAPSRPSGEAPRPGGYPHPGIFLLQPHAPGEIGACVECLRFATRPGAVVPRGADPR